MILGMIQSRKGLVDMYLESEISNWKQIFNSKRKGTNKNQLPVMGKAWNLCNLCVGNPSDIDQFDL